MEKPVEDKQQQGIADKDPDEEKPCGFTFSNAPWVEGSRQGRSGADAESSMPRHSASRSRSPILDTGLPDNDIWFILVDGNAATCCSTEENEENKEPSTEENKVATEDPYMTIPSMTIPRKKRKKKKRSLTKKEKEKKSEKEKEKKAERSTVKMYY